MSQQPNPLHSPVIRSFVLDNGKVVGEDMDLDALRLVISDKGLLVWVDLENPTPEENRKVLEEMFHFHPLAIEDCVQVSSLPKVDDYEEYLFLVMHGVSYNRRHQFDALELNLFIGRDFLVTYHTEPMASIDLTRERCRKQAMVFARASDRLAHVLLDALVGYYNQVLDNLAVELQGIEDSILEENNENGMAGFMQAKKELSTLHRTIQPQREVIGRLARGEFKIIRHVMLPYYRDIYDQLTKIDEAVNAYKEQLFLSMDIYLNKVANKTNDIIRVLTVLTAFTMPVMIIGTWYGMNFPNMPEISDPEWSRYSYLCALGLMIVSTAAIVIWFKRKKYL